MALRAPIMIAAKQSAFETNFTFIIIIVTILFSIFS